MAPRHRATVLLMLAAVTLVRSQSSRPESEPTGENPTIASAREAIVNADREHGATSIKAAAARRMLAQALFQADRLEEGIEADRQVLAILEHNAAANQSNFAQTRMETAAILYRVGRPD